MNTAPERTLLEGLAREDKVAIERIYKENYNMIQSLVVNNSGTVDDAADIFQEAMIILYEKSKNPDFELHCHLKTFIYSICRRLWLKKLQQMQRFSKQTDDLEPVVAVEEDLEK